MSGPQRFKARRSWVVNARSGGKRIQLTVNAPRLRRPRKLRVRRATITLKGYHFKGAPRGVPDRQVLAPKHRGIVGTSKRFMNKYMSDPENHYPFPHAEVNARKYANLKAARSSTKIRKARDNSAIVKKGWLKRRRSMR